MMFKLTFLGLLACTASQLIYPDEFEMLKTSMQPPLMYTFGRQRPPTQNAPQAQNIPPATNVQYSPPISKANQIPPRQPMPTIRPEYSFANPTAAVEDNVLQGWDEHVNSIIVKGLIKFSLDVEREIYNSKGTSLIEQQDNIVFSPISIAVALAIVLAGSAGRTFSEVSRVLGLESGVDISRNSEVVHQMFGILMAQLHSNLANSEGPRLDFATAAYVQDGYPILQVFKTISQSVYGNEVINVDFARNGRSTQQRINAWVKQKTRGKIDSILNDVPSPDTTLILLSALYFNGEWNQHFLDGATRRKQFFIEPDLPINVDMMYNGGQFPFYEDKQLGVKIVSLPYKGHQTSMYVVQPTAMGAKALRGFLSRLSLNNIENLIKNMKNETCIIGLPKMKLSSTLSLRATLENLGLTSLFNPAVADLSLISQGVNGSITSPVDTTEPTRQTQYPNNGGVTFDTRSGEQVTKPNPVSRRNYFAYEDKNRGYTVEQWSTGFSIKKSRKRRSSEEARKTEESKDSYKVMGSEAGEAKVVNLEANKYRFQEKQRTRRQSRPIDQDFLKFIKDRNFPSYGLDALRNSANLVNPHIFASDVLHKVEIDITEKGTEAAAVTGVIIERDGNQKRLVANRPFLFFIRHDPTGLILFWGTVNAPTPNY